MTKDKSGIETVSWSGIRSGIQHVVNWYDWEISGTMLFRGERVYFTLIDSNGRDRKFGIYNPPPEVWQEIDERIEDFRTYVGDYWDFVDGKHPTQYKWADKSEWPKFYDKWRDKGIKMKPEWLIAIGDSAIDEKEK